MGNKQQEEELRLTIDLPEVGMLRLTIDRNGQALDAQDLAYDGHVDNLLLTAVDNLFKKNTINRPASVAVCAGEGIDKNSSLYRIVTTFASALAVIRGR